jgi:hypothetical protein
VEKTIMSHVRHYVRKGEAGHAPPLGGALIAAVGAVLLGIGAASDGDALAIIGGIVLAVGLLAMLVINHMSVEYDIYRRLGKLEE